MLDEILTSLKKSVRETIKKWKKGKFRNTCESNRKERVRKNMRKIEMGTLLVWRKIGCKKRSKEMRNSLQRKKMDGKGKTGIKERI